MNESVKYYLVLENRPGDYNIIEINRIPGYENYPTGSIEAIDNFTKKYTETELRDLIIENNIVRDEYVNGIFKIISDSKKTLLPLTKERMDVIKDFMASSEEIERPLKDKLYGYYKKILETFLDNDMLNIKLKEFKKALNENNKEDIFFLLGKIPYYKGREIYFMLWKELMVRKESISRTLEKNDKLNDVA